MELTEAEKKAAHVGASIAIHSLATNLLDAGMIKKKYRYEVKAMVAHEFMNVIMIGREYHDTLVEALNEGQIIQAELSEEDIEELVKMAFADREDKDE